MQVAVTPFEAAAPPPRPTRASNTPSRFGAGRFVALYYAALACFCMWPLLPHLRTQLNADPGDGADFVWGFLEVPGRLVHGESPFASSRIFYPVGADLSFHAGAPVVGLVVALLEPILGLALAVNLTTLAGSALTGIGTHLVARHERVGVAGAYFAGTAFVLLPNRLERQGTHYNFFHTELLVFAVWAVLRFHDSPTWKRGLLFGVLAGLTYLNEVTWGVVLAVLVVVLLLARRAWRRIDLVPALAAAGGALVVAGPFLVAQLLSRSREGGGKLVGSSGIGRYGSDALSWFVPPAFHPWWGTDVDTRLGVINNGEGLSYVGLTVMVLAAIGLWTARRWRKGWGAAAFVFGVAAMGPFLKVLGRTGHGFTLEGEVHRIPLPFALVHQLPVLDALRAPGRFVVPCGFALAILAGVGLTRLVDARPHARWIPFVALALLVLELPVPTSPLRMSPKAPTPYAAMAKDPRPGAVLELPMIWTDGTRTVGVDTGTKPSTVFLLWNRQSHTRPVVSGFVSRLSESRVEKLEAIPTYRSVLALEGTPGFTDEGAFTAAELGRLGIRFVVYHRDHPVPALLDRIGTLDLEPVADDGTVVVWAVR